jgi:hypothetical protein
MVMNLKGPNFVEPAFANICFEKDAKVEGVVHELAEIDLERIVTSEGETYELVEAPVTFKNQTIFAKTLRCKESKSEELPASRRYMKILIAAAIENKLSSDYVKFLKNKKCLLPGVVRNLCYQSVFLGKGQSEITGTRSKPLMNN